jgi:acetyltransferase-like isoleucine patch superfamily enzyme
VSAKKLVAAVLSPAVQFVRALDGLRRAWAWSRLAAALPGPLDPSVVILGVPEIHGSARISLGKGLYLYREVYLETQGDGAIEIGDNVVISRGTHIVSFASVTIGVDSMIGEYSSIRDADHKFQTGAPVRESGHTGAPIVIGRNVWIGRGVAVLAGVTIGDNAVVGANAVVTRDVPAGSVVAGVPARDIRPAVTSR